jgi:HD-GYP domain-containing protein (c-di-GMP phosphodiesterase class II)
MAEKNKQQQTSNQRSRSILVVDPDQTFLDLLKTQEVAEGRVPVLTASDGKDAHQKIADLNIPLFAIFINPKIEHPSGLTVIRLAHQYRPAVPIYIIYDSNAATFTEQELQYLAVHRTLRKPITEKDLTELAKPLSAGWNLPDDQGAFDESKIEDQAYRPVRAQDFLFSEKTYFDLYICLPSGKHIKILNAGDDISKEQIKKYHKKGVTLFYIRREAQERYLKYCDQMASQSLKSPNTPIEVKVNQMVLHGDETMKFLKHHGLRDTQLEHASNFINQIQEILRQDDLQKHTVFKAFMANLAAIEHGTGVSIVSSLVASSFKVMPSPQILGVASLFHDIGLMQLPAEMMDEAEESMTEEQTQLYVTHPTIGSQILSSIGKFNPAVCQAVAQHHQRLHGKGFPKESATSKPTQLAELLGISDEFVRLIEKTKHHPEIQPLKEMERKVFEGFSRPVVDAFRNFFFLTLL